MLPLYSQDQLLFKNGDVISGKYLGKTDSLIFFDSHYFGTLKIPTNAVELKLEGPLVEAPEQNPQIVSSPQRVSEKRIVVVQDQETDKKKKEPAVGSNLPSPIVVDEDNSSSGLGFLWETAERTLNRFVHDRVPDWFPQLPENWKGQMKFGFNLNEAIDTSTRYYGEGSLEGDHNRSNYQFKSHFAYAKQSETRSEHDWGLSARYRYKLKSRSDFFESFVSHDVDELFEPHLRTTSSIGFGIKPYQKDYFTLDTVLGGALERQDRRNSDPTSSFKLNFNENLKWKFNKHLTLKQSLRFYLNPDEDLHYNYRFESGIDALIVGAFNLGLSYRLDFDSAISDDDARQKSRIMTTLGIKF